MIVLGADTHKRSHTIAAVAAVSGELLGEQTVQVGPRGFGALFLLRGSQSRLDAHAPGRLRSIVHAIFRRRGLRDDYTSRGHSVPLS
jgi:hypothetical protein